MKKIALHWQIIIGLVAGGIFAFISSSLGWSEFTINWINPWGEIFIRLLKLIAVPLVMFSIIKGITGLSDANRLGRLGAKTLGFYLVTTVMSVSLGLLLVNTFKPGTHLDESQRIENRVAYENWVLNTPGVEFFDEIRMATGKGDSESTYQPETSDLLQEKLKTAQKTKDAGPLKFLVDMVPSNIFFSLNNNGLMLQIIFFAIFFGIVMISLPREKVDPMIRFVDAGNEIFLKMVDVVMKGAPYFVFALIAGVISKMAGDNPKGVQEIFIGLGSYSLVVVLGLAIMVFLVYPIIASVFVKRISYAGFFKAISPAQLLAFSSSSSAATLPVTMECVNENLKVNKEVTSFVLPIGATVNMDGTSLYQAVAVIFLAQMHMVDLSFGQQLTIVLTATLASIGSAAVPSAGLIMLIIVLQSVGLNPAWIAIIFPVDRILDMCRTVVNVTGDATVASLVASSEKMIDE